MSVIYSHILQEFHNFIITEVSFHMASVTYVPFCSMDLKHLLHHKNRFNQMTLLLMPFLLLLFFSWGGQGGVG